MIITRPLQLKGNNLYTRILIRSLLMKFLFVARRFLFFVYLNCFPQCLIYNWTQYAIEHPHRFECNPRCNRNFPEQRLKSTNFRKPELSNRISLLISTPDSSFLSDNTHRSFLYPLHFTYLQIFELPSQFWIENRTSTNDSTHKYKTTKLSKLSAGLTV